MMLQQDALAQLGPQFQPTKPQRQSFSRPITSILVGGVADEIETEIGARKFALEKEMPSKSVVAHKCEASIDSVNQKVCCIFFQKSHYLFSEDRYWAIF